MAARSAAQDDVSELVGHERDEPDGVVVEATVADARLIAKRLANPLFGVSDRWEVAGYSFAVSKSSVFTKSDILSFGLMRTLGIIDGSVDYLLPTYFGDEGHAVDVSHQSTPFVMELGYSHTTEFARLGGSLSYTMNDTGVGGEENFAASLSLGTEF